MLGILVQLILSWIIIYFVQKKDLGVLGFMPTRKRLIGFVFFFILTALCCASGFFLRMYFGGESWTLNPNMNTRMALTGVWWNIKSVLFEELIFRGVLLYILIKRLGMAWGIIISSVAFGIYHWFSHEVIGNYTQMAFTFLITGTMGLVYAYGYARSWSILIPSAIHLGWNLTQGFIFSSGPTGDQLLIYHAPEHPVTVSQLVYYILVFAPLLSAILLNFFFLKKYSKENGQLAMDNG